MNNQAINPEAVALHNQARESGQRGNFPDALAALEKAISIEPDWAYPYYDMAFTYLLQQNFQQALKYYTLADEKSPRGFFTVKMARHTLEKEKEGVFPEGLYLYYLQSEWTDDKQEKLKLISSITSQFPAFAPAWKDLANLLDDTNARMHALDSGLAQDGDSETMNNLRIAKALLLDYTGNKTEAHTLITELLRRNDLTDANAQIGKLVSNQIMS
jgi:tetratricopeptide (TPR) repeat protein